MIAPGVGLAPGGESLDAVEVVVAIPGGAPAGAGPVVARPGAVIVPEPLVVVAAAAVVVALADVSAEAPVDLVTAVTTAASRPAARAAIRTRLSVRIILSAWAGLGAHAPTTPPSLTG